ncbi:MAG: insulinase family protein [Verrucomicrobiota bacterium JB022]|nr:insulinase family protein [Verrucomicrobiota bacterium JB022]
MSSLGRLGAVFLAASPLLAAPQSPYASDAADWPQEASDLQPAADVVYGQLDNGLRYAIVPHQEPPGRLSLRLLVESGSLMETDAQQGIAHFLEHMAFNGSKNIEPGKLVEIFQRLGMSFGADTNAHTTFDETVYKFELPDLKEQTLDTAMLALRDYADGLLLLQEEVDRERGVILSEMRDRDNADYRASIDGFRWTLPYSLIPNRMPIGQTQELKAMMAEDFRDYYDSWYTLDRMAVVAVGDADPEQIKASIEQHFASMEPLEETLPDPALGGILSRGEAFSVYSDPELTATEVSIATSRYPMYDRDSKEARFYQLAIDAANLMLDRRLEELAKQEGAPFTSAHSYGYTMLNFVEFAGIYARTSPEQWEQALPLIEQELRRSLEHGFTQSELEVFLANQQNMLETAVAQAPSRQSRSLADEFVALLSKGKVYLDAEQQLELFEEYRAHLTPEVVLDAWRAAWSTDDRMVRLESQARDADAALKLRRGYEASRKTEVEPYEDRELGEFAYAEWGEPAKVVSREPVEGLENTLRVEFDNHVVLYLKKTAFEQNNVRVAATLGSGMLTLQPDQRGLAMFTEATFISGGLEAHSADDLNRLLAGHNVGASFSVGEDAFTLAGVTTMDDLDLQLDLMVAYLTHPGYREEAARRFRQTLPQIYQSILHTADGVAADKVAAYLSGDDFRFGFAPMETVASRQLDEVKAWLTPALQKSKLELAVVGDIDEQAVIDAVAATFGALPDRETKLPDYPKSRKLEQPTPPDAKTFTFGSELPKARVIVAWPTVDMDDIFLVRRLSMLADIFDDRMRLKIREAIGQAYSPYAYNLSSQVYEGYGYLRAVVDCDPEHAEEIAGLLVEIGDNLSHEGFDEDEFQRLLLPRIKALEQQQRNNPYWLGRVLLGADSHPEQLEWSRSLFIDYPKMTAAEVLPLAEQYLQPDRALRIIIQPVPLEGDAPTE